MFNSLQYLRKIILIISDESGNSLDFSKLRVVFRIKKTDEETPNSAIIRIYNLSQSTVNRIKNEFTRITLNAGYQSNFGLIFDGNIKQVSYGRENSTDNYVDISAGDGDQAYNFSIVNKTLSSGANQRDQIIAAADAMNIFGVSLGFLENIDSPNLPRAKVMFGMSRAYLTNSSKNLGSTWSIQNSNIDVIKKTATIPQTAIILDSKSGVIGTPKVTNGGIYIRTLLNPILKIGVKVKLDNESISDARISQSSDEQEIVNSPPQKNVDGVYRIIVVEFIGDNFGNDWFSDITCLSVDETAGKNEEVSAQ